MNNHLPKVSVVMPVYNSERFVRAAILSILSQSFNEFELIIVNDGSTDQTHQEILSLSDHRIKYFRLTSNKGNYFARNYGNSKAVGRFIAVMDADDICYENRLQVQVDFMNKNRRIGGIGTFGKLIDENGNVIGSMTNQISYSEIKINLLKDNCFLHPSLMLRRSLLVKNNLRYDTKLVYASDYDFFVRCSKNFLIKNIPEVLLYYRQHNQQISTSKRAEQVHFADSIRLKQLQIFKLTTKKEDKQTYLKMLKNESMSKKEISIAADICNNILQQNSKLRILPMQKLYSFFQTNIRIALSMNYHTIDA